MTTAERILLGTTVLTTIAMFAFAVAVDVVTLDRDHYRRYAEARCAKDGGVLIVYRDELQCVQGVK
jgi:hypothetical protein